MGKFHVRPVDLSYAQPYEAVEIGAAPAGSQVIFAQIPEKEIVYEEKIIYVDRPVEKQIIIEKPVEVIVEKEVPRIIVEYKTVEVPVMYEKEIIKEVPVYIEKEVSKIVDISDSIALKRKQKSIVRLKAALAVMVIINLIILMVK